MDDKKYRFIAEWFDPTVKLKREFLLTYFPADCSVEMFDRQQKRLFLKRLKCENISTNDLFVGGVINVLSRQLLISGFGDKQTEEKFKQDSETSLIVIKSEGYRSLGVILDGLQQNELTISRGRMVKVENNSVYLNSSFITFLGSDFAVFEVRGENAINVLLKLMDMQSSMAEPLKATLGVLNMHCLVPTSYDFSAFELKIFFPSTAEHHCNTAVIRNSTCCIIKPHILREGTTGKVVQDILDAGFTITALEFVNFDLTSASEFHEVYKGAVSYYTEMVGQLMSGTSLALEITKENSVNVVQEFRELTGPANSEVAKKLRPRTLRARYGHDHIKNAVHCTDLPEDGAIEVEYVFCVLASG